MSTSESQIDRPDSDRSVERLNYELSRQNAAQSYNAEMSKWILASLIFINSGPFLLISKDAHNYNKYLSQSAGYFILGITLAVLCGFLAWLNTGMREWLGSSKAKRLLEPHSLEHKNGLAELVAEKMVIVSYCGSVLVGFGSLITFLIGAFMLSKSPLP
ncbi:hypothetical protein [Bradyrhizobium sp. McL0616]|uniref:hypothetical protein n=1 Tax=Bradyrhizobium sp. McL0616 TaxID=3415674 RepID=UPI003CF91CD4